MKKLIKNFLSFTLITLSLCGLFLVQGCDGGSLEKAVTETVKKAVGNEVTKKSDEVKKQLDQFLKPGSDKNKDGGEKSSEGNSENKSHKTGGKEDD